MKDFRQLCPACKQTLELPISASGKLAQCPDCETTFTAGEKLPQTTADAASAVQSTEENASLDAVATETERETLPEPVVPQDVGVPRESSEPRETVEPAASTVNSGPPPAAPLGPINPINSGLANPINRPIPGNAHDNAARLSAAEDLAAKKTNPHANPGASPESTEQHEASAAETADLPPNQLYSEDRNPFSQPLLQESVAIEPSSLFVNTNEISNKHLTAQTQITIVSCSIVEVFKITWAIMLDRGLLLLASLLVLIFIVAAILLTGTIATWIMSLFISDTVMFMVYRVAITLICVLTTISLCRNAIGVVRKTPHLLSDSSITFHSLLNILVPASLVVAVASYYKWQLLPLYSIDITVVMLIGLCTTGTLGWFWSSIFLCSDMQCSGFKSLLTAARIFYRNKISTVVLLSTFTVLIIMGIASRGILLIVVLPFIQLLMATSYLMMTNQPFANPRYQIATDETI
jgi:hypothetical protein